MIHGHIKTTVMDYGVPEVRSQLCIIIISCERLELRALEISEGFRLLTVCGRGVKRSGELWRGVPSFRDLGGV